MIRSIVVAAILGACDRAPTLRADYSKSQKEDPMNRRSILSIFVTTLLALALLPGNAVAQQKTIKEQLVGTWTLVSWEATNADGSKATTAVGPNLKGILIFDAGGRFSFQAMTERPKFAIGDRMKATPEENHAVMQGMLSYFGTYTVNEADKSMTFQIVGSSFPNQYGTNAKRVVTALTADELKYTNVGRTAGGQTLFAWQRAK